MTSFLDLPRELRDKIYYLLLRPKAWNWHGREFLSYHEARAMPERKICRQIRRELLESLLNTFTEFQRIPANRSNPTLPASLKPYIRLLHVSLPRDMIFGENLFGMFGTGPYMACSWKQMLTKVLNFAGAFPALKTFSAHVCVTISGRSRRDEQDLLAAWYAHPIRQLPALEELDVEIDTLGDGDSPTWKYSLVARDRRGVVNSMGEDEGVAAGSEETHTAWERGNL